jgi:hypothetical protein
VERFIGRSAFVALYLLLLMAPSIVLSVWGVWQRTSLVGSGMIHFGIFLAFATIYPRVELILSIMAKWIALVLIAAYSLRLLAYHVWSELAVLWLSVAIAYCFVRLRGVGPELIWFREWRARWRSKKALRVVTRPTGRRVVEPENVHDSIDPVLDKISRSGIGSLTASERRALDRARARLLKKSK